MNTEAFKADIEKGYTFKGDYIVLGGAMLNGECQTGSFVKVPLKTLNRHGLIAGSTGSGKTKTLQIIAEQLSAKSIPSLLMDIKGDLSGIAKAATGHPKIDERHARIGLEFTAGDSPVDLLSLTGKNGARLRATPTEFGPLLLSKIMDLNESQQGVLALVFKYCDDKSLPLLDLDDLKKALQYLTNEGKSEIEADYGRIAPTSAGTILRKIIELEQQGADSYFGEPSFEVADLCRIDAQGRGVVNIIRLDDVQDKPKLFSSFMLQLLAEIYASFPEEGDSDAPKLVIFIDEAHLVFQNASKPLLDQIETMVKLIRSKGIGLFFVTQVPSDVPDAVLSQLGLKVQHSLRAFTAKDRKAIKLAAENFPITPYYKVDEVLTSLGIGEAFVTALNEKGIPTPLVHTLLRAPQSRMDILTDVEIAQILASSPMVKKYSQDINRESAYEILNGKIEAAHETAKQEELKQQQEAPARSASGRREKSTVEKVLNNTTTRQIGRTVARELTRGLLGVLGIGGSSSRKSKKSGWF
ncbi:MAG: helicase HerA-like domain-containing protein [Flavobacteriales bacterium]